MLAIQLDKKTEERLARLARKSGRTKTLYAREVILEHLEDLKDARVAMKRLAKPAPIYSADEVKRALDL